MHNSSKYTTMIHAQLFQCPFNNCKSINFLADDIISVLNRIFPFKQNPSQSIIDVSGKKFALLIPSRIFQTYA